MGDLMCAVRVVCLRHGEFLNDARVLTAVTPGPGLTPAGRAEAASVVSALRTMNVRRVYGSQLRRARETAEVIGDGLGVAVETRDGLAEFGMGEVEGSAGETERRRAAAVLRTWLTEGDLDARITGGESGTAVLARFSAALQDIADRHRGETVAVVSHAGTLALGLASVCVGLRPADVWGHPLGFCLPVTVEYDGETWRYVSGWPGTAA